MNLLRICFLAVGMIFPSIALAQGFEVGFGSLQQDTSQPVEVTADSLSLNQSDGTALFKGNVLIIQGAMRMSAPEVLVFYNEDSSGIDKLEATGGVLLVKDEDAAEAERADYHIADGIVVMTGDVVLTQGNNSLNSNTMRVNLETGKAELEGRVKTILKSGSD